MTRQGFRKSPRPLPRNVYRRASQGSQGPGPAAGQQPLGRPQAGRTPGRSAPFCQVKAQCGNCKYVNLDYRTSLDEKAKAGVAVLEAAGVLQHARVLPAVPSPRPFEYRSLFKLAVRPAKLAQPQAGEEGDRFAIGLFEPGSHDVINMDDCPLHVLPLKRLLRDLRTELNQSTLTPYDETTRTGQLRYVAARAAHLTGELMVTFVVTEPLKLELRRLVDTLQRRGHKINSAHMNLNTQPGNAIFGPETHRVAGTARLRERLCDLDFEVSPTSFFQVNPWQAINLYRRVELIAGTASGAPVAWDLYCGTGQISLLLARQGYRVLGIEENPASVADAEANAKKNHLEKEATFLAARVEDAQPLLPAWAQAPRLIVANPSRRGLAESTRRHLKLLLAANPQARFVYVSCEVETLARDLKELAQSGFQVRQVEPFDMFPQTDNLEWLVVMSRA